MAKITVIVGKYIKANKCDFIYTNDPKNGFGQELPTC